MQIMPLFNILIILVVAFIIKILLKLKFLGRPFTRQWQITEERPVRPRVLTHNILPEQLFPGLCHLQRYFISKVAEELTQMKDAKLKYIITMINRIWKSPDKHVLPPPANFCLECSITKWFFWKWETQLEAMCYRWWSSLLPHSSLFVCF